MLPRDKILCLVRVYLLPGALLALAACSNHDDSTPAAVSKAASAPMAQPAASPATAPLPTATSAPAAAAAPMDAAAVAPAVAASSPAVATTAVPPSPAVAPAPAAPATGTMVPYDELADLQYYQLEGTNKLVIELFDGRTTITDINCGLQTSGAAPVLLVHILGSQNGPETPKIAWDTEGNAVYYFDAGKLDVTKLHVVYEDEKGRHDIPNAGLLDRPFDLEKPTASSPSTSGKQ